MYIVAGLGNPGLKYADTRHNVGFMMIDVLARTLGVQVKKLQKAALTGEGFVGGEKILLVKPQTFMNLSGESLRELVAYYKVPNENVIVVYDEAALDLGRIRIRAQGSDGGHNGMKNILYHLGTDEFLRVRIGIGAPIDERIEDYVLDRFSKREFEALEDAAKKMPGVIEEIITNGVLSAMNKYNG